MSSLVLIFLATCAAGCKSRAPEEPAPKLDYAEARAAFRTKLTRKGPSPQENGPVSIGRMEGLWRGGGLERRGRGGPLTGAARAVRQAVEKPRSCLGYTPAL
ncbi:hypothetical protein, partial [Archangium sp.]|uniref:hypothetical protein n=1 Tax=Archangium sp. TaxID=1872627 RepID=UPI002D60899A